MLYRSMFPKLSLLLLFTGLLLTSVEAQKRAEGTTLISRVNHASGIPLGGIGTGSVEIMPDGTLRDWQIFNLGSWAVDKPENEQLKPPAMKMRFFLRAQMEGEKPLLRRLTVTADDQDMYNLTWAKNVQEISFVGKFPVASLAYKDDELPVAVSSRFLSPFIPHNSRVSGIPGFYAVFTLENLSHKPVRVSLLSTLANPLAWEASDRKLKNTISQKDGWTTLAMRTDAELKNPQTIGSMSLSMFGGDASWIGAELATFIEPGQYWPWFDGGFGTVFECMLNDFRVEGRLPNLAPTESPEQFLQMTTGAIDSLSEDQKTAWVKRLRQYAYFESFAQRILRVDGNILTTSKGKSDFIRECRDRINMVCGNDRSTHIWGDGALSSSILLKPGEKKDITIILAWHFPNHMSELGPNIGHMYENWFRDAQEVSDFLAAQASQLVPQVQRFSEALYTTSLGTEMADAWSAQLSTLVKTTWWVKNGDFGVWEGLGCCGFHTTDITYQGSFSLLALFPDLQKRQMEMGAKFQRADGRIPHNFDPDLSQVDNGFDRVDMNQQFVLLVCRDYLWTGDKEYLKRMWPHILRALANTAQLDADGDGLPDHDTRRNTYDAWNFYGTPSYISSLWLGSLRAAIRLANDLGEKEQATRWSELLEKGTKSFSKILWNGEYYSLWVDKQVRDECCMSDQMSGEWFTQLIGLGTSLPKQEILSALHAVYKYNFNREHGLINANYPSGKELRYATYQNAQSVAPWTGIEYANASLMMEMGMNKEAHDIISSVYDRYLRAGRMWNHEECGSHYYRAMSSWAVLLSVGGFKVDVPNRTVSFVPAKAQDDLTLPWFSSQACGITSMGNQRFSMTCQSGEMQLSHLKLRVNPTKNVVTLNGKRVKGKIQKESDITVITFDQVITIKSSDQLIVE